MEGEDLLDRAEQILRRAWPDGLSADDAKDWARLSQSERRKALRRIHAVQRFLKPLVGEEPFVSAESAADSAQTGLSTFYAMLKRWKEGGGLAAFGVRPAGPRGSGRIDEGQLRAERLLVDELSSNPAIGTEELLRRLASQGFHCSRTTGLRLVEQARREMPITGFFGRLVVIDSAGLDLIGIEGERLRLHGVVDVDTKLMLGWSLWPEKVGFHAYRYVADGALKRLDRLDLTGARATGEATLEIRFPPDDVWGNRLLMHNGHFVSSAREHVSERATGRRIVKAVGNSVAGIWIGTGQRLDGRSYRTGRADAMPTLSDEIIEEISRWLERHNEDRLGRLPRDGRPEDLELTLADLRSKLREVHDRSDKAIDDQIERSSGPMDS